MAIQWFPGHMHLTRKAVADRVKQIDVVIEMLDARLPGSSANPLLAQLTSHKPVLRVLNKQDMADPARTQLWLDHFNASEGDKNVAAAIALDASMPSPALALTRACRALVPERGGMIKPLRVLICGIPNVGKSTLINTMVRKKSAKTGDEAGVTRTENRYVLDDDFYLFDTPGMLWPRIIVPESGTRLAASGAVGRNAYDDETVALDLLGYLKTQYPSELAVRYKLSGDVGVLEDEDLLDAVGRQRGALQSGGRVDTQKAAEKVIGDFRSGHLGRLTLETPNQYEKWLKAGRKADAERAAAKAEREAERKTASKARAPRRPS